MNLAITSRTLRNVLQNNSNVRYPTLCSRPPLTKFQKKLRLEFAKKDASFGFQWKDVVFSDEKKNNNLFGLDSFPHYCYDLRKDKPFFFSNDKSEAVL